MMSAFLKWFANFLNSQHQRRVFLFLLLGLVVVMIIASLGSWWYWLVALIVVVVVYLSFTRPLTVLLFLLIYLPFEPFLLQFVPEYFYVFARYFSEILIYLLLAITIWQAVREKHFVNTPLNLPVFCLLGVALLSWFFNLVPIGVATIGLRQIFRFIFLYFIVVNLRPSVKWTRYMVFGLLGVAGLQSVLGVFQAIIGGPLDAFLSPELGPQFVGDVQLTSGNIQFWEYGKRVFGTLGRYDQLGTFLSVWLLMAVGFLYEGKKLISNYWSLVISHVSLVIGALALILTYSRASWFGFLAGLLVIGLIFKKDRRLWYGLGAVGVLVAGLMLSSQIQISLLHDSPGQTLSERVFEVFSLARWEGEYYGLGRLFFIVETPLKLIPLSPILGVGPGQFGGGAVAALHNTTAYDRAGLPFGVYGTEGYIDNNWFSLWGELGTLGLIIFIWILWRLVKMSMVLWQQSEGWVKGLALGFIGVVIAVSVEALLGTYFEVRTLAPYLWVLGGLVYVLSHQYAHNSST